MGRAKVNARAQSIIARKFGKPEIVGLEDPFPSDFIDFVRRIPPDDGHDEEATDPRGELDAKRRKLEATHAGTFSIAKSKLIITRHQQEDFHGDYRISQRDLTPYVYCQTGDTDIIFRSRAGKPVNFAPLRVLTLSDLDENIGHILRISRCKPRDRSPGGLWAKFGVIIERRAMAITMTISFHLYWNETSSPLDGLRTSRHRELTGDLIDTFFPKERLVGAKSPMDFYEAAYVPPVNDETSSTLEVPGLDASLFPYQRRTLQWLLGREGVQWSAERRCLEPLATLKQAPIADSSRLLRDTEGRQMYVNDALHTVSSDMSRFSANERAVSGGILAEEMGLGKTLEILGLILLHGRPDAELRFDSLNNQLIPSKATLIVTPESLRQQWISELSRHAPGLRVEFYQGCKRTSGEHEDLIQKLAGFDVVLTTYTILSAELHFANDPPERSRRQERKYERAKSPLVQISWWRLCLDEAQMIENGFSQAAMVARVIPRMNGWGVTGTPVKDNVNDLFGLMQFLRYEPLWSAPQVWQSITKEHKPLFQNLFNSISLRHTKALVRNEITLPPQRRFVISIPFTAVEEQHYQSMYKEMTEACGVDTQGNPIVDDWIPEHYEEDMRVWLNRLRQTALHPEVGAYNRRVLGQNKARPMRTVEEVLDAMLSQSENSMRTEERSLLSTKLTRGQILENSPRVREALEIWEEVRAEAGRLVADARAELKNALREQQDHGETGLEGDDPEDSDGSDEDALFEGESKGRIGEYRRRLRGALEMQHKAVFFCANAYFQIRDNKEMTPPDSEAFKELKILEDDAYEEAKRIRREILQESHRKASRFMGKITRKGSQQHFVTIPELTVKTEKGIESGRIVDDLEDLYGELNDQADAIDEWREHVVHLLLKTLLDEEDDSETTGEELGDSAKVQDELVVYVQVLRAAIADRQDAMTGQTNELVKYETQTSIRMAKNEEGPAPAKLLELFEVRERIKPGTTNTSMRGAISEFRSLISRLGNEKTQMQRTVMEHRIAQSQLQATMSVLNEHMKIVTALESEIESFTTTMNARLEYYRQLQSVSDSVLPYEGARTEAALAKLIETEASLRTKLSSTEAKHRYLVHLKEAGSKSSEPRVCVICQTSFETGVLTVCGHQFCKECMMMWFKAHRNCPVCKKHLSSAQLHDITMKPQELKVQSDIMGHSDPALTDDNKSADVGGMKKTMIYSTFDSEQLAEIKNIDLDGPSYTTKVDTLVRHLLWLRDSDPGAKSIIFSQYKDFLGILATAFRRFRIGFASIDTPGGTTRFKEDPSVECFLLHARAHASGLNLVNANHVFLCEPLVNTALELQAIARVDRIGQRHETTVWLYMTSGTVEESIYNLSVKRRMHHMGKADKGKSKESTPEFLDASLEAANTLELEQAALTKLMSKDKTAGEVVEKGDLWECLFGRVAGHDIGVEERAVEDITTIE